MNSARMENVNGLRLHFQGRRICDAGKGFRCSDQFTKVFQSLRLSIMRAVLAIISGEGNPGNRETENRK